MNKLREAGRLILTKNLSSRKTGDVVGLSHTSINRHKNTLQESGLDFIKFNNLNDNEIENLLKSKRGRVEYKIIPDWFYIYNEMQKKHVTLQLLWEEYRLANPVNAYSYSQFTYYYREYVGSVDRSMRQTHRAGEKVFVDFAGRTVPYINPKTGKKYKAQIFVSVLGCSKYTFAYAVPSQSIPDWIEANNRMWEFYNGVTEITVPDNLKAAVIKAGQEPILNRTYLEQSRHYGVVIIPARVRKPKDKADAENGVLAVSRWVLVKLRNMTFFSTQEINAAIAELLKLYNERPFKQLPGCRRSRFIELDKPMLSSLPEAPFEFAEWTSSKKVSKDYHLPFDKHYYSVPHQLVGQKVETRSTKNIIEFFHKSKLVASHHRSYIVGGHTTLPEHQTKDHRQYAGLTSEGLLKWAKSIGPATVAAVKFQFDRHPHAALGIRACAPLQNLAKKYSASKFEAACMRAKMIGSLTPKSIRSILQNRLSEISDEHVPIQMNLPIHENVRGSSYYE